MLVLPFPNIDPVMVSIGPIFGIGPINIHWYAMGYIVGIMLGWVYIARILSHPPYWTGRAHGGAPPASQDDIGDLVVWVTLGIILGGRIGFILFYGLVYSPQYYTENPLRILMAWQGGMSFHGGLIGAALAVVMFCRRRNIDMFKLGDLMFAAAPIGIFLVRMANFINGELWGKVTTVPWAMVFPNPAAGPDPRHPSQIYEAVTEGLLLFLIIRLLITQYRALDRPGLVSGVFLIGYGVARIFCEVFRDSDQFVIREIGFTMGMLLCLPMIAAGMWFLWYAYRGRGNRQVLGTA